MALNLLRNSRVFFTTDLDSSGKVNTGAVMTAATTRELQVLDGFSFSQNTGQETVTTNEAGISPVRGQRSFNTSLEPVDWSFTTYIEEFFKIKFHIINLLINSLILRTKRHCIGNGNSFMLSY